MAKCTYTVARNFDQVNFHCTVWIADGTWCCTWSAWFCLRWFCRQSEQSSIKAVSAVSSVLLRVLCFLCSIHKLVEFELLPPNDHWIPTVFKNFFRYIVVHCRFVFFRLWFYACATFRTGLAWYISPIYIIDIYQIFSIFIEFLKIFLMWRIVITFWF